MVPWKSLQHHSNIVPLVFRGVVSLSDRLMVRFPVLPGTICVTILVCLFTRNLLSAEPSLVCLSVSRHALLTGGETYTSRRTHREILLNLTEIRLYLLLLD